MQWFRRAATDLDCSARPAIESSRSSSHRDSTLTLRDRARAALGDKYMIEEELGRGGMAVVFRARDVKHDRAVAVKVMHPELAEAIGAERFLREVQITARLSHPHILPLLDSGAADGLLYYIMPLVEGESLRDRLTRERQLPIDEALRITTEVADALGRAHAAGIVHRDIKPENILLQGSHALVTDFGIARATDRAVTQHLTVTGTSIGTPLYMSPEQASGESAIDGRSDQYSLACVTFEMLTGEPPYAGPNASAITARKLTERVPLVRTRRDTVSEGMERAVMRALAKSAADRFQSIDAFASAIGASSSSAPYAGSARRLRVLVSAGIALIVLSVAAWIAFGRRGSEPVADATRLLSSVAVLPLQNLSTDSAQAYFAEGLADELTTSLSKVSDVRVASRTSTSLLARQGLDLATLGKRLGVATVLEGSVRAGSGRLRVSARLIKVSDGYLIWSDTYERAAADAFNIQAEIAGSIVAALLGELKSQDRTAIQGETVDPDAYDLYLQGRALRQRQTAQSLNQAATLMRRALARAPNFARAHSGLGEVRAVQGFYEFVAPREAFPEAASAAEAALRVDPRDAAAAATRAYVSLYYDWDLVRAEREFVRAIQLDPNSAIAHQWYGNFLTAAQRWDEAEAELSRSLQLDPAAPVRHAVQVWGQHMRGDHARAVETFQRVTSIDSSYALTFQWGAEALEQLGRFDDALAALEWAVTLSNRGAIFVAALARVSARRGNRDVARNLLAEVQRAPVVPHYDVATVHLALGDRAEALRALARAYDARSHSLVFIRIDRTLAPLRGDKTFEEIARKVGM